MTEENTKAACIIGILTLGVIGATVAAYSGDQHDADILKTVRSAPLEQQFNSYANGQVSLVCTDEATGKTYRSAPDNGYKVTMEEMQASLTDGKCNFTPAPRF